MGFFSDLKDDLSQAVNEFKPDEEAVAVDNVDFSENVDSYEATEADLSSLLENIDTSVVSEEMEVANEAAPVEIPQPEPVYEEPVDYTIPVEPVQVSKSRIASDEVSVIMDSMIINGNMATEGSLELRGAVVGNVECLGKLNITGSIQGSSTAAEVFADGAKITGDVRSMGPIKIGQSTTIIGNVFATSAVVAGAVKGDIDVKGPVVLDSTAIVLGNIKSKAVQINNGAVIEGLCSQCYAEVNPKSFFEELKKMK